MHTLCAMLHLRTIYKKSQVLYLSDIVKSIRIYCLYLYLLFLLNMLSPHIRTRTNYRIHVYEVAHEALIIYPASGD